MTFDKWNGPTGRLKLLELIEEAQRIQARNEANQSWVTSSELKQRLAQRGMDVGSSL